MTDRRLLIITNRYPTGPDDMASPFIYDFRNALETRRIAADIVTPFYRTPAYDDRYVDAGVHFFDWSDGARVISQLPFYHPATFLRIFRYFRNGYKTAWKQAEQTRYDAILALWALPSGEIARKVAAAFDLPYAVWTLGSDINSWAKRPFIKGATLKVLKGADQLFADGYLLAAEVEALTERECRFLPSFHKVDLEPLAAPFDERFFLCVGRIEEDKGVFDLLNAFRAFSVGKSGWKLYYVGIGRAEKELRQRIKAMQAEETVECRGYLERRAVSRLMTRATAIVIPSHADSLPLTFGEAMQAGRPVITSDIGDMPYFIDKYRVGYHYPVGNIPALADRMEQIITSAGELAPNCPKVVAELDISNSAAIIEEWLESLESEKRENVYEYAGTGR